MVFEFSVIRWIGLVMGIGLLVYSQTRYRTYRGEKSPPTLVGFLGLAILGVAVFPSIVNLPAEALALKDVKGGRLITLLLVTVIALTLGFLWNRYKVGYLRERLNKFIKRYAIDGFRHRYPNIARLNDSGKDKIWVVIPALDEEDNIPFVLGQMPSTVEGYPVEVLVVDDGSSDRTGLTAQENGAWVVSTPFPCGGGLALRCGYEAALLAGASWVVTLDADGQNDPGELSGVVKPLLTGRADVVIGSRLLGKHEHTSLARTIGVPFFNFFLTLLLGRRVSDCASNYRGFTAQVLSEVELSQEQYHTAEMVIETAKRGFRIEEVPISFLRRRAGVTKKGGNIVYGAFFLRTILKTWFRR